MTATRYPTELVVLVRRLQTHAFEFDFAPDRRCFGALSPGGECEIVVREGPGCWMVWCRDSSRDVAEDFGHVGRVRDFVVEFLESRE